MREFDRFKESYRQELARSTSFLQSDIDVFYEVKARLLARVAREHLVNGTEATALDVGCGVGLLHRHLKATLGTLVGVDVSAGVIETAARDNRWVHYVVAEEGGLPFKPNSFDLVFAICVLHHVPPEQRAGLVAEMVRVTKPSGVVAVVEHNPLNPLTRVAVSRCSFDEDVTLLRRSEVARLLAGSGLDKVEARHILFFPWRSRSLRRIEDGLGWLPLGAQHLVVARKLQARPESRPAELAPAEAS